MTRKPNLHVVQSEAALAIVPDAIIDTGPAVMLRAAKLNRLLETRAIVHEALEVIARDGSVAEVMHFLRSETKLFAERMKP